MSKKAELPEYQAVLRFANVWQIARASQKRSNLMLYQNKSDAASEQSDVYQNIKE